MDNCISQITCSSEQIINPLRYFAKQLIDSVYPMQIAQIGIAFRARSSVWLQVPVIREEQIETLKRCPQEGETVYRINLLKSSMVPPQRSRSAITKSLSASGGRVERRVVPNGEDTLYAI